MWNIIIVFNDSAKVDEIKELGRRAIELGRTLHNVSLVRLFSNLIYKKLVQYVNLLAFEHYIQTCKVVKICFICYKINDIYDFFITVYLIYTCTFKGLNKNYIEKCRKLFTTIVVFVFPCFRCNFSCSCLQIKVPGQIDKELFENPENSSYFDVFTDDLYNSSDYTPAEK